MGLPAATVTQKIGFQFFSVALDAIQFPLSLRVLPSGRGSGPQAAHEASALPGGWAESLEAGGEDQYETHPGELLHPVCFALTHLIILGKTDKSDWITILLQTLLDPH